MKEGEDLKIRTAELKTVCGYTSTLPESEMPEIAFAGRSNVGKSSLINVLMQRKRLARVGETPGKTRTINFYEIDALIKVPVTEASGEDTNELSGGVETRALPGGEDARGLPGGAEPGALPGGEDAKAMSGGAEPRGLPGGVNAPAAQGPSGNAESSHAGKEMKEESRVFQLVDLPGYGYANVSKTEKEKWGRMIERYLRSPRNLHAVFLLVDIRHEPNANDRQMYDWIVKSGHTPVLIATKADKVKRSQLQKQMKILREGLKAPKGTAIYPFSALTGSGREEICRKIAGLLCE